jgi:hypothetical protein
MSNNNTILIDEEYYLALQEDSDLLGALLDVGVRDTEQWELAQGGTTGVS